MKYPQLNKDVLHGMYWVKGKNTAEIGKEVGCSSVTIINYMKKFCVPRRGNSEAQKGKRLSEKTRRRISEATKGEKNHMYGKHRSEKICKRISEANKGERSYIYGKQRSEETKRKMSEGKKGEKNYNWQGGISYEPYCPEFNFSLKEKVRERYGRKCFLCGKTEKEDGRRLSIHHIDGDKMQGCNDAPWMLVPLCMSCHGKIQHDKNLNNKLLTKLENVEGAIIADDLRPTMCLDHYLEDAISV